MSKKDLNVKIVLIGNSSVGKTSLIHRYIEGEFKDNYISTIGTDMYEKSLLIDNQKVFLRIMDTSGQERFRSISQNFYRGAHGIIFVFDITNEESFKEIDRWLLDANDVNTNCKRILVGNKIDLKNNRKINKEKSNNKAINKNLNYYETSAKTGENVEFIFGEIVRLIINDKEIFFNNEKGNMKIKSNKNENNKQCCK